MKSDPFGILGPRGEGGPVRRGDPAGLRLWVRRSIRFRARRYRHVLGWRQRDPIATKASGGFVTVRPLKSPTATAYLSCSSDADTSS